jgi:nicotinamide-nucleotide amidase
MAVRAEVLTVGDELCRGEITDTNSQYLAERLTELGLHVSWLTSTTDDAGDLDDALALAAGRAQVVIVGGGLGPTHDDRTVDVVSARLGVAPVEEASARAHMERRFAKVGFAVTPNNLRQVRVPEGAEVLPNRAGLAPGFRVRLPALFGAPTGADAYFVPGVPREMKAIFEQEIVPRLAAAHAVGATRTALLRVFGIGESHVDHRLAGLVDGVPGTTLHFRIAFPETLVKIVVRAEQPEDAEATLARLAGEARTRLGVHCYGTGDDSLASVVGASLRAARATVAFAESCTGGLATHLVAAVPGASDYLRGGIVAYANEIKMAQLRVDPATIEAHGAVSEATALEMARGIRRVTGSDYGVAITGIAGPGGGSEEKPVGTVHLAVVGPSAERHERRVWAFDREQIQRVAAFAALELLRRELPAEGSST